MNNKLAFMTLISFLLLDVTGCSKLRNQSFIQDQNRLYVNAKELPPLQMPADLKTKDFDKDQTVIPSVTSTGAITPEPPLPPGSLAQQVEDHEVSAAVLKQKLPSV